MNTDTAVLAAGGDGGNHPAPLRHRVRIGALWFGLTGAPAAWSAQLVASYAFSAHSCFPRLVPLSVPQGGASTFMVLLLAGSVIALCVGALALITAVRSWHATVLETNASTHEALDVGEGRTRFMALAGIFVSTVFLLGSCALAVLVLVTNPCTLLTY